MGTILPSATAVPKDTTLVTVEPPSLKVRQGLGHFPMEASIEQGIEAGLLRLCKTTARWGRPHYAMAAMNSFNIPTLF